MELQSLDELERRVTRFLDQLQTTRRERDEMAERVGRLEAEIAELQRANGELKRELEAACKKVADPEKDKRIRSKVDELLAKLEGF